MSAECWLVSSCRVVIIKVAHEGFLYRRPHWVDVCVLYFYNLRQVASCTLRQLIAGLKHIATYVSEHSYWEIVLYGCAVATFILCMCTLLTKNTAKNCVIARITAYKINTSRYRRLGWLCKQCSAYQRRPASWYMRSYTAHSCPYVLRGGGKEKGRRRGGLCCSSTNASNQRHCSVWICAVISTCNVEMLYVAHAYCLMVSRQNILKFTWYPNL